MDKLQQNIISALEGMFSNRQFTDEDRVLLKTIQQEIAKLSVATRQQFAAVLLSRTWPLDHPVALYFFLYDCFRDVRWLERALAFLPDTQPLPVFYETLWNIRQRLFTSSKGSATIDRWLRQQFDTHANQLKRFLQQRGLLTMNKRLGLPKTIAILSPQILTMRHSPTREAMNLALRLSHDFGCTCYVFNTNGMNYEEQNELDLLSCSKFNFNNDLSGIQQINVNYMEFNDAVNVVSFEAGAMTTQKIAGIVDTVKQLNVDALIAHGENLLVMEALYGSLPSLFATTGAVVPFQHCDAYFVPGDLINENTQRRAEQYGHTGEFMHEGMLVTPEGQADTPAERSRFGLSAAHYIYLVVGTRLVQEIDHGFSQMLTQLLANQDDAIILFAGSPELKLSVHFSQALIKSGRIQNIGFQQDLAAISLMASVYLNPMRNGGGTSGQTALINDTPVVTLDRGHVSTLVPQPMRSADWSEYASTLDVLRNRGEYANYLQEQQAYYAQHSDIKGQVTRIYDKLCELALRDTSH